MPITDIEKTKLKTLYKERDQLRLQQLKAERFLLTQPKAMGIVPTGVRATPVPLEEQLEYEKQEWLQQQITQGKIKPIPPSFWQRFKADIPQMGGATALAIYGAQKGFKRFGPKGGLVGGVGGAALGAMGGKGWQQFYQMVGKNKPMTLDEIYTEQAIAGIEEGAAELIGRGVVKIGGKALAPLRKRLLPGAKKVGGELLRRGAHLTPAQMTESRIVDTLEGMAEKSFLGGGKLQQLKAMLQPEAFQRYIDDVVGEISRGSRKNLMPEEVGELLLDTIYGKKTAFKATAKAAYGKVDKLTGRTNVSLKSLKEFARQQMKVATARKGIGSTQAGDALLKKVLKLDDVITFRQAQGLRSAFIDERGAMAITKDKAIGLAKQFIKISDDAMEQGAKELSPEALKAWRIANKFYKTGMQTFDKKLIRNLTKNLAENPEIAVKKIFQPGATEQIKVVKNLVDDKTWHTLKTAYLEKMLIDAGDIDRVVLGKSFAQKIAKLEKTGVLKEVYNGQEIAAIKSIGQLGSLIQRPTGGSGGMLIQLMQAGAIVNLGRMAVGGAPALTGESAVIVIGPPILSRMLANPKWAKWLAQGYKLPAGTPEAAALAVRLLRANMQIKAEIVNEKQEREQGERLQRAAEMTVGLGPYSP